MAGEHRVVGKLGIKEDRMVGLPRKTVKRVPLCARTVVRYYRASPPFIFIDSRGRQWRLRCAAFWRLSSGFGRATGGGCHSWPRHSSDAGRELRPRITLHDTRSNTPSIAKPSCED